MSENNQVKSQDEIQTAKSAEKAAVPWYSKSGNASQIMGALIAFVAAVFSGLNWYNSDSSREIANLHSENTSLRIQNEQIKSDYHLQETKLKDFEKHSIQLRTQAWASVCHNIDRSIPIGLVDDMSQIEFGLAFATSDIPHTYRNRLQFILDRANLSQLIVEDQASFRSFSSSFIRSLPSSFNEEITPGKLQSKSEAEREPIGAKAEVTRFDAACEAAKPS